MTEERPDKGQMSVAEAGRKGGETTSQRHGEAHYQRIGKMGGQKVKRLIAAGKEAEGGSNE